MGKKEIEKYMITHIEEEEFDEDEFDRIIKENLDEFDINED